MDEQIYRVHRYVNRFRYLEDQDVWGVPDYWAVPEQLFGRGGDCEDYALTEYISLRALGFPASRLRLVLVHDEFKDVDHAVLMVASEKGTVVLDNNHVRVMSWAAMQERYRPYYALNEKGVWLDGTRVLSAQVPNGPRDSG